MNDKQQIEEIASISTQEEILARNKRGKEQENANNRAKIFDLISKHKT